MAIIRTAIEMGEKEIGRCQATCPHCRSLQTPSLRELRGGIGGGSPVFSEAFLCPQCEGASRYEGTAARWGGAIFLVPFAILLSIAVGVGTYILTSMVMNQSFSVEFATIAAVLIIVAGYFDHKTILAIRMLVRGNSLIPLDRGFMTALS